MSRHEKVNARYPYSRDSYLCFAGAKHSQHPARGWLEWWVASTNMGRRSDLRQPCKTMSESQCNLAARHGRCSTCCKVELDPDVSWMRL
jgi:hypothetical protein